jgi:hypothetical protein
VPLFHFLHDVINSCSKNVFSQFGFFGVVDVANESCDVVFVVPAPINGDRVSFYALTGFFVCKLHRLKFRFCIRIDWITFELVVVSVCPNLPLY